MREHYLDNDDPLSNSILQAKGLASQTDAANVRAKVEALKLANNTHETPDQVVARAEAYLTFLQG